MSATATANNVVCPKCNGPTWFEVGGKFWGNGLTTNGKAKPTHKCKDKNCGGAVWQKDVSNVNLQPPRQAPTPVAKQPHSIGTTGVASLDNGYVGQDPIRAELESQEEWAELRVRYLDTLDFVLGPVLRKLTDTDIGASPESVAAITAAIWIERNKRGV